MSFTIHPSRYHVAWLLDLPWFCFAVKEANCFFNISIISEKRLFEGHNINPTLSSQPTEIYRTYTMSLREHETVQSMPFQTHPWVTFNLMKSAQFINQSVIVNLFCRALIDYVTTLVSPTYFNLADHI